MRISKERILKIKAVLFLVPRTGGVAVYSGTNNAVRVEQALESASDPHHLV